jgi:hypothetical protein
MAQTAGRACIKVWLPRYPCLEGRGKAAHLSELALGLLAIRDQSDVGADAFPAAAVLFSLFQGDARPEVWTFRSRRAG